MHFLPLHDVPTCVCSLYLAGDAPLLCAGSTGHSQSSLFLSMNASLLSERPLENWLKNTSSCDDGTRREISGVASAIEQSRVIFVFVVGLWAVGDCFLVVQVVVAVLVGRFRSCCDSTTTG